MSTQFIGEGNIGSPPEYREFPNGNDDPRRLLRLNVYFDNPVPTKGGEFEDRGGFWAPVEIWHQPRETWQINARSVGILPYRIESVALSPKPQEAEPKPPAAQESTAPKETKRRK